MQERKRKILFLFVQRKIQYFCFLVFSITISFNVNHTVDTEEEPEISPSEQEKPEFGEMKSRPTFEVDIKKDKGQTLSFTCSFLQGEAQEGEYNDVFSIDEVG